MSAEDFHTIRDYTKDKFAADKSMFLKNAKSDDDGGWAKHSEFHWSRQLSGYRLDYWPSRKKFQYRGKVRRGDIYQFIKKNTSE